VRPVDSHSWHWPFEAWVAWIHQGCLETIKVTLQYSVPSWFVSCDVWLPQISLLSFFASITAVSITQATKLTTI